MRRPPIIIPDFFIGQTITMKKNGHTWGHGKLRIVGHRYGKNDINEWKVYWLNEDRRDSFWSSEEMLILGIKGQ